MHLATVGLYDSADAVQTKTVMVGTDFSKRLAPPIVGGSFKWGFWLLHNKKKLAILHFDSHNEIGLAANVPEGVGKKLAKRFLQKLRINIQHRVTDLNVPGDCRAFPGEITVDFLTQIFREVRRTVRDGIGFDVTNGLGKGL